MAPHPTADPGPVGSPVVDDPTKGNHTPWLAAEALEMAQLPETSQGGIFADGFVEGHLWLHWDW